MRRGEDRVFSLAQRCTRKKSNGAAALLRWYISAVFCSKPTKTRVIDAAMAVARLKTVHPSFQIGVRIVV